MKGNKKAAPVLMIGYGSYGVSLPMHYRPEVSVLLREGWTVAYACARGGGELGPSWHAQGRGESKWNTFIDFAACAAYLHSQGIGCTVAYLPFPLYESVNISLFLSN
jgi:protease II